MIHIEALLQQELSLALDFRAIAMSAVAAQAAVAAHDTVTGHFRSKRIPFECLAHRLCRTAPDPPGQLAIGNGLPRRNLKKFQIHPPLEGRYLRGFTDNGLNIAWI